LAFRLVNLEKAVLVFFFLVAGGIGLVFASLSTTLRLAINISSVSYGPMKKRKERDTM
jgi:hypothetical protein